MTGIELIAREREEQLLKHGRNLEHDIKNNKNEELREGAVMLLLHDLREAPTSWDDELCQKMVVKPYVERLKIAGALLAAEIDRINSK